MEQRMRHRLRRLIELSVEAVAHGFMPMSKAAETMEAAGAPFEVVCRVLLPFKDGVPRRMGAAARAATPVKPVSAPQLGRRLALKRRAAGFADPAPSHVGLGVFRLCAGAQCARTAGGRRGSR